MKNNIQVVNDILYIADMEYLVEYTENSNEYLSEAKDICSRITDDITAEELSDICREVFNKYFSKSYSQEDFIGVARCILDNI